MHTVVTVVGARPQFVKAAPVIKILSKDSDICHILIHTGQHYDRAMSDDFFETLEIPKPDYNLGEVNVNIVGGTQGSQVGHMMSDLEPIFQKHDPDMVVVYGDTNSTLAAALVASKMDITLTHIEAGMRSWNRLMPEETNRIVTDSLSSLLFCSSKSAMHNVRDFSGIKCLCGDLMYNSALLFKDPFHKDYTKESYILATIHRNENVTNPERFRKICVLLGNLSMNKRVIFPMHPGTYNKLFSNSYEDLLKDVKIQGPAEYVEMQKLLSNASHLITDSGGLQNEAHYHSTPCITFRSETEWSETFVGNWNALFNVDKGTDGDLIELLSRKLESYKTLPYAKSNTDMRICSKIKEWLLNKRSV